MASRPDVSRKVERLVPAHVESDGPIRFRVVTGDATAIFEIDAKGPGLPALGDLPREMLDGAVLYIGDEGIARRTR